MKKLIVNSTMYLVSEELYNKYITLYYKNACKETYSSLDYVEELRLLKIIMETCNFVNIDNIVLESSLNSVQGFYPLQHKNKKLEI